MHEAAAIEPSGKAVLQSVPLHFTAIVTRFIGERHLAYQHSDQRQSKRRSAQSVCPYSRIERMTAGAEFIQRFDNWETADVPLDVSVVTRIAISTRRLSNTNNDIAAAAVGGLWIGARAPTLHAPLR